MGGSRDKCFVNESMRSDSRAMVCRDAIWCTSLVYVTLQFVQPLLETFECCGLQARSHDAQSIADAGAKRPVSNWIGCASKHNSRTKIRLGEPADLARGQN
jgi:hypothetical protein